METLNNIEWQLDEDILRFLIENKNILSSNFNEALNKALDKYAALESDGVKDKLKYIYISFLRSGFLTADDIFRIDLLDNRQWSDINECESYFAIPNLYEQITDAVNKETIKNKLGKNRVTVAEVEQYQLGLLDNYVNNLHDIMSTCVRDNVFIPENTIICFGEYLGDIKHL